ncbi:MAG: hypothetical protein ACK48C_08435, partial [Roseiflexaceae bacterium]
TAAQVVYDRLARIKGDHYAEGIETMVLDIHDQDSKPERVKAQIKVALDMKIDIDAAGYDIQKRDYEQYLQQLKLYPQRLHEVGRFGESIYSARDKLLELADGPTVTLPGQFFIEKNKDDLEHVRQTLRKVQDEGSVLGATFENPWRFVGRSITPTTFDEETQANVHQLVKDFYELNRTLATHPAARDVIHAITTMAEVQHVNAMVDPSIVNIEKAQIYAIPEHVTLRESLRTQLKQLRSSRADVLELNPQAIDIAFPRLFQALATAEKSIFIGRTQRVSTAKQAIMQYIKRGSFDNFNTLDEFAARIGYHQQAAQQLRHDVRSHPIGDLPIDWNPFEPT